MQLDWAEETKGDFRRLKQFLVTKSPRTANNAIQAIRKGAQSLIDDPELGTSMNDGTLRRELPISFGKYAYILRYVPDYDAQLVRILRIWHTRESRET